MSTEQQRRIWRANYHRRKVNFMARGLNSRGRKYGRTPNLINRLDLRSHGPELLLRRKLHIRRRVLKNYYARTARLAAQGLTNRGTPRKYRRGLNRSPLAAAWQELRAQIEMPAVLNFESLSIGSVNR
jgi:hypothetical protein